MSRRPFSAVRTEGGLLPQDLLARIQAGDSTLAGTKAKSYHLGPHERVGEAVNRSWTRLVATWHAFQDALAKQPEDALATGLTRERWLLPLFQELGYGRLPKGSAIEVEGRSYAVSHTWHRSPIHLLGAGVDLDRRQKGVAGAAKSSPHGLVQEFLNRSDDHLWGFVTNGFQLRVLRDHHSLTRQAYVEFDLQTIMDGEQYSEFLLLWLVCHQSRVEADKPEDCWLETWCATSREEGVRALDKLRGGVEKAIEAFGAGFLASKANTRLHEALASGELDAQEYYRQVLRLVYRLIFLFVAEERDALLDPDASETAKERYRRFYATRRLRDLADKRRGGPHGDLWRGVALVMTQLDTGYPPLALPALGSRLWGPTACPWLMDAECANAHVLSAVRQLSHIQDGRTRYPVNWRNVGADELGSIYEGLLELHPRIHAEAGTFELDTAAGHERKTTGSYYTPTSLVDCLLDSALDPVLDEAAKKGADAILELKVCDPACGSGHFLVAAARRIAKRLASVRSGDDEPSPRDVQRALRDVVGRCVFGVDVNPMAVELCKVSLWMEAIEPGRPLSFLDSHIQCGNALLGTTPALMARGIPNDAFKPIEGDDKEVAKRLTKRNRDEHKTKQERLPFMRPEDRRIFDDFVACDMGPDFDLASVREQETCWVNLNRSRAFRDAKFMADAWCAAFVWPKQAGEGEEAAVTQDLWRRMQRDAMAAPRATRRIVRELARQFAFFHWHLAFPAVFGEAKAKFAKGETTGWTGGFDVVLGNPPWEMVEQASDDGGADRTIAGLQTFAKATGLFPGSGGGRKNLYGLFSERGAALRREDSGQMGMVLPTEVVQGDIADKLARDWFESGACRTIYDFQNRQPDGTKWFPSVHPQYRFALVTLGPVSPGGRVHMCFDAGSVADILNPGRAYAQQASAIARLCYGKFKLPMFFTPLDGMIAETAYTSGRALGSVLDQPGAIATLMFNFGTEEKRLKVELANAVAQREGLVRVFEGEYIHQYDHRHAHGNRAGGVERVEPSQKLSAHYVPTTVALLPRSFVEARLRDLFGEPPSHILVLRRQARAKDSFIGIAAIVPSEAVEGSLSCLATSDRSAASSAFLCANLNSFVFNYLLRGRQSGPNVNKGVYYQIPVVDRVAEQHPLVSHEWVLQRVIELVYTAWDLSGFAQELGYDGAPFAWDTRRREWIRAELEAGFFHLYGLQREHVEHVVDAFDVLKRRELKVFGEYRSGTQILRAYDRVQRSLESNRPYDSLVDPTPAHSSVAHPESCRPSWPGERL